MATLPLNLCKSAIQHRFLHDKHGFLHDKHDLSSAENSYAFCKHCNAVEMVTQVLQVSGRHPEYLHQYIQKWRERETDECETARRKLPTASACDPGRASRLYAPGRRAVGILPRSRDEYHHLPGGAQNARFSAVESLTTF
jgi:hypothetical protein